jgi:hypothetical protein
LVCWFVLFVWSIAPFRSLIRCLFLVDHHAPSPCSSYKNLFIPLQLSKPSCTNSEPRMMNQYFYIKNVLKINGANSLFLSKKHSNLKAT